MSSPSIFRTLVNGVMPYLVVRAKLSLVKGLRAVMPFRRPADEKGYTAPYIIAPQFTISS